MKISNQALFTLLTLTACPVAPTVCQDDACQDEVGEVGVEEDTSDTSGESSEEETTFTPDLPPQEGFCGDGEVQEPELCDMGSQNGSYGVPCSSDCLSTEPDQKCGDGKLNFVTFRGFQGFWEECDDGNNESGDGCSEGCKGEFEPEECMTANLTSACFACAATALQSSCGPLNQCAGDPSFSCPSFMSCLDGLSYTECLTMYEEGGLKGNNFLGALLALDPQLCTEECHLGSIF